MEDSYGVGAAADAGDDGVGESLFAFEDLMAGLAADDGLEVADHLGIWVGSDD